MLDWLVSVPTDAQLTRRISRIQAVLLRKRHSLLCQIYTQLVLSGVVAGFSLHCYLDREWSHSILRDLLGPTLAAQTFTRPHFTRQAAVETATREPSLPSASTGLTSPPQPRDEAEEGFQADSEREGLTYTTEHVYESHAPDQK